MDPLPRPTITSSAPLESPSSSTLYGNGGLYYMAFSAPGPSAASIYSVMLRLVDLDGSSVFHCTTLLSKPMLYNKLSLLTDHMHLRTMFECLPVSYYVGVMTTESGAILTVYKLTMS